MNKRKSAIIFIVTIGVFLSGAMLMSGCAAKAVKTTPPVDEKEASKQKASDLFMEGKLAEAKEDWPGAIASYMEAFQYDPESDDIAFALAKVFFQDQKFRSALYYVRAAAKLNPMVPDYWRLVQLLEQQDGQFEKAAEALTMYMKLKPDNEFIDRLRLAQYHFANSDNAGARKILVAMAKDPALTSTELFEIGDLMEFNGLAKEAESIYTMLIERDPLEVKAWLALSEIYRNQGDSEAAFRTYMQALEKNPGNVLVLISIGNHCLMKNDWDCAVMYFEKAFTAGSDTIEANGVDYFEIMRTLCIVYFYAKRDGDASGMFDKIIAEGKDNAQFYFSLGKAMNFLERFDDAVSYYQKGFGKNLGEEPEEGIFKAYFGLAKALIRLDRGSEALQLVRTDAHKLIQDINTQKELEASVCMELKQYDDVIAIYEWLLSSDPDNRGYLLGVSIVYDLTGQFKNAEKVLLKVLEEMPEDPLALNNLAYMYLENNMNYSKALKMVQEALILDPENGAYLDTLGWAYYKLGKYKDAKKHIERALKRADNEDKGVIYEHYGDILVKLKSNTEALDAYGKALESGESKERIQPKIDGIPR